MTRRDALFCLTPVVSQTLWSPSDIAVCHWELSSSSKWITHLIGQQWALDPKINETLISKNGRQRVWDMVLWKFKNIQLDWVECNLFPVWGNSMSQCWADVVFYGRWLWIRRGLAIKGEWRLSQQCSDEGRKKSTMFTSWYILPSLSWQWKRYLYNTFQGDKTDLVLYISYCQ